MTRCYSDAHEDGLCPYSAHGPDGCYCDCHTEEEETNTQGETP